ncbi:MAG: methyltransferase domain-containing protein, partial [Firmicutes bacterium]|nr:methyltransferase domain-containing protein [Bacillota bacterium]
MRMRKKPWAEGELAENPLSISSPEEKRGRWREFFGNENPVYIELGCGKGGFISKTAKRYPDVNFIGLEKQTSVIAVALRLSKEASNIYFLRADAADLEQIFAPGELSRIYLNFSDPWPRKKWAKRRLTH